MAIYKLGDDDQIINDRPISILDTFTKVFESFLCPHIRRHFNLYLIKFRHGFVDTRSICTNLVTFSEILVEALDSNMEINELYTDFRKTSDCVPHNILLKKVKGYGFARNFLDWLTSYFADRYFCVVI